MVTTENNVSEKLPRVWTRGPLLGQGRFGKVFLLIDGVNPEDERYVIKDTLLPLNHKDKSMIVFRRETQLLMLLETHDRIVPFYGSLLTETVASIFLGYMTYGSLHRYCEEKGPLIEEQCILFTKQILQGLKYLHERRIIHRDIKGSNILLENEKHLRLSDFGISKFLDISSNTTTSEVGTWRWMAPEICNPDINDGKYNFQADIWSVGCTVTEMLTGRLPYADIEHEPAVIFQVGHGVPPTIPQTTSKQLKKILKEMVFLKRPKDRKTAETLLEKLEQMHFTPKCFLTEYFFIFFNFVLSVTLKIKNFLKAIWTFVIYYYLRNGVEHRYASLLIAIILILKGYFQEDVFIMALALIIILAVPDRLQEGLIFSHDLHLLKQYIKRKFRDSWAMDVYIDEDYSNSNPIEPFCSINCYAKYHDCILSLSDFKQHYIANFRSNGIYGEDIYGLIKSVSKLTVQVSVKVKNSGRFRYFPGRPLMYTFQLTKDNIINGTGMVYGIKKQIISEQHCEHLQCPCQVNHIHSRENHACAEIHIMTAAHLIPDEWKRCEARCRFFFDSPVKLGSTVEVVGIEELDVKNNWCVLKCVTCDPSLIRKLDVAMETFENLRIRVYETHKPRNRRREESDAAFIVSHPYGLHKHVSIGHRQGIRMVSKMWSEYFYEIKTFPGSAGAYVYLLGYSGRVWHYPHLHKSSNHSGLGFHVN